jgi:hypothetical protein
LRRFWAWLRRGKRDRPPEFAVAKAIHEEALALARLREAERIPPPEVIAKVKAHWMTALHVMALGEHKLWQLRHPPTIKPTLAFDKVDVRRCR